MFDAGLYKGGRYFIPYDYSVHVFIINEKTLGADQAAVPETMAYEDFAKQVADYIDSLAGGERQKLFFPYSVSADKFLFSTGLQFVDYENGTVMCDQEAVRTVTDLWKTLYPHQYDAVADGSWIYTNGDYAEALENQQAAIGILWSPLEVLSEMQSGKRYNDFTLRVSAMPNLLGGKRWQCRGSFWRSVTEALINKMHMTFSRLCCLTSSSGKRSAYQF